MQDLADYPPHLVDGVRHPEPKLSRDLEVRGHRDVAASTRDGDERSGALHPGPDDVPRVDGVAESNVDEGPERTDIAHGGEPGHHGIARVAHARERFLRARPHEESGVLPLLQLPNEVRVAVDQAGYDRVLRQVDDLGAVRIPPLVGTNGLDPLADDLDDLRPKDLAADRVDQASGADDGLTLRGHGTRA
jgi:hypothetical protein